MPHKTRATFYRRASRTVCFRRFLIVRTTVKTIRVHAYLLSWHIRSSTFELGLTVLIVAVFLLNLKLYFYQEKISLTQKVLA